MKEEHLLDASTINDLIVGVARKHDYKVKTLTSSNHILSEIEDLMISFIVSEDRIWILYGDVKSRKNLYIKEKLDNDDILYYARFICLQTGILSIKDMIG